MSTRGQGFGLSTSGGPGTGATLDVADFCCPDYIVLLTERIKAAWIRRQEARGLTTVKITIQRDGTLASPQVERSSGFQALALAAMRAVMVARQIDPLSSEYPNLTVAVHLHFDYQR